MLRHAVSRGGAALALVSALTLLCSAAGAQTGARAGHKTGVSASALTAALADPGRPAEDVGLDAARKAVEVITFTGVKPGDKVIERFPGHGYYTRILSKLVGPTGKVYVMLFKRDDGSILDADKADPIAAGYSNVVLIPSSNAMPQAPEPVDTVISLQNYHDLHVGKEAATAAPKMNSMAAQALKPGGSYIVIDHEAPKGVGATLAPKTHRIEMSTARSEIEAAGFKLARTSEALRNPGDPKTMTVSDPSITGKTDRFMMAFRKAR